ncbi:hypothetical protein Peur_056857 [Populus x canadensis]|jgi:hypothetical protein
MNKAILVLHDPIPFLTNNVIEIERDYGIIGWESVNERRKICNWQRRGWF